MSNEQVIRLKSDRLLSFRLRGLRKVLTSRRLMTGRHSFTNLPRIVPFNISSVDFMENLVITRHEIENTEITISRFLSQGIRRNFPLTDIPVINQWQRE